MVDVPPLRPGCRVRIVALQHGHNAWYLLGETYTYELHMRDVVSGPALTRSGSQITRWAVRQNELSVEPKDPTW